MLSAGDFLEGFSSDLANVLHGGAGSNLREINVYCDSIDNFREIGLVLREGACPKLEEAFAGLKGKDPTILSGSEQGDVRLEEVRTWLDRRGVRFYHYYFG